MANVDDQAIELLRKVLKVEQEESETRRLRVAEQTRVLILENIVQRYANLGEETRGLLAYFRERALQDDALQDFFANLSERMERMERILTMLLAGKINATEAARIKTELENELDEKHLKRLLQKQRRNLNKLQERQAEFAGRAPVELLTQIEDIELEIAGLEQRLKQL